MNRSIWLAVAVVLVFAVILIARLPAAWVLSKPGSDLSCADTAGTIWNGTCTGMVVQHQPIGDLNWEVHAWRLLSAKFAATVLLTRAAGVARGTVEVGFGGHLTGHDIHVDLPLDPRVMPQLPPNLSGSVQANLSSIQMKGNTVTAVEGEVQALNLQLGTGPGAEPLGSYSLTFSPSSGAPIGQLRDLGGPLQVEGTLRLTPEPGFDLQSLVKPRANAPEALTRDIQFLGSPDAQGRRPFALAASF
ncbi:MAG TPA: type II secretion system protein N [Steroidobacteraceae bacterium]|nr:type II secretion system protein N [Steroidobacteraceae bacterium]